MISINIQYIILIYKIYIYHIIRCYIPSVLATALHKW